MTVSRMPGIIRAAMGRRKPTRPTSAVMAGLVELRIAAVIGLQWSRPTV